MVKVIKDIFWHPIRKGLVISKHNKVLRFWTPIVERYYKGQIKQYNLEPKNSSVPINKVIWQYWGQGFDNEDLPKVVCLAMKTVDKYKGDYTIIRLSDSSIKDYIDFPDFVYDKLNNKIFNRTFFSDLLRFALLSLYGGVWLDATVLLSSTLPSEYLEQDFFAFQRLKNLSHSGYWERSYTAYWGGKVNLLNAILLGKYHNIICNDILELMLYYWNTQDKVIDYFFMQLLFRVLVSDRLKEYNCNIVDDSLPHLLHTYINGGRPSWIKPDSIFEKCSIHKLTYFTDDEVNELEHILSECNII